MIILGLTGSIGMGKTTAARNFRSLGVSVHGADEAVHAIMDEDGAASAAIEAAFPGVTQEGRVDRRALAALVFDEGNVDENLACLEAILHPLVRQKQTDFIRQARDRGEHMVVLEAPLLLETGGDKICDGVVVVTAPADVQAERVLRRPDQTKKRLRLILARQMPDEEKRRRADFIIETDVDLADSLRAIENIVKDVQDGTWTGGNNTNHA